MNIEQFSEQKAVELTEMMYPGESEIAKAAVLKDDHRLKTKKFIYELITEWEHTQAKHEDD